MTLPTLVVTPAVAIANLVSSTTYYQAPYQPIVRVVSEEVEGLDETLKAIIECESRGNPAAVNLNKNGTKDWGILQINDVHKPKMKELGLNIENPDHSLEYGLTLYEEQGVKPWLSSAKCWRKMLQ